MPAADIRQIALPTFLLAADSISGLFCNTESLNLGNSLHLFYKLIPVTPRNYDGSARAAEFGQVSESLPSGSVAEVARAE